MYKYHSSVHIVVELIRMRGRVCRRRTRTIFYTFEITRKYRVGSGRRRHALIHACDTVCMGTFTISVGFRAGARYSGPRTVRCCRTARKSGYRRKAFSRSGPPRTRTEAYTPAAVRKTSRATVIVTKNDCEVSIVFLLKRNETF